MQVLHGQGQLQHPLDDLRLGQRGFVLARRGDHAADCARLAVVHHDVHDPVVAVVVVVVVSGMNRIVVVSAIVIKCRSCWRCEKVEHINLHLCMIWKRKRQLHTHHANNTRTRTYLGLLIRNASCTSMMQGCLHVRKKRTSRSTLWNSLSFGHSCVLIANLCK